MSQAYSRHSQSQNQIFEKKREEKINLRDKWAMLLPQSHFYSYKIIWFSTSICEVDNGISDDHLIYLKNFLPVFLPFLSAIGFGHLPCPGRGSSGAVMPLRLGWAALGRRMVRGPSLRLKFLTGAWQDLQNKNKCDTVQPKRNARAI